MAEPVIRAEGLGKTFRSGEQALTIFSGLTFQIRQGESVALVGKSGAGKSTLLHILGALEKPTTGKVLFCGDPLVSLSETQLADYRNRDVGFVWQNCHLLPEFTAIENVALPLRIAGVSEGSGHEEARTWLHRVGLAERIDHQSGELSGGEQQRVAIARALVSKPRLLLADEPTGNLDERTGEAVMKMLIELARQEGLAILLATHNPTFAALCDRVFRFEHGRLRQSG
ncbi:MAG: ABC transporter ATP-binding protein [Bryobacterales bacterium]|nr:ABC transporter ATP-binding protein [Bryobacterales bacterium]MDE0264697.1 ABC transporter ATP-binding protein [Bryobacterales bacterium]MDE0621940.1 ABC transporter ATP-binding protein [Bryobacterales bacterium]